MCQRARSSDKVSCHKISYCAEGIKSEIISYHHLILDTFYVADQASGVWPAEPTPNHKGKTYEKKGDDLKD